jgi:serine-type D-Ala-D-Ala carboxypeptidase/endopeptidase
MRLRPVAFCLLLGLASCAAARPVAPPPAAPASSATAAPPVAPPALPSLSGIWLGTLPTGGKGLRLQLHLDLAQTPASCSLDSLDQHAMAIPCGNVVASGASLSLDVPAVHGTLTGPVSADGNTVNATWTQGGPLRPLVLTRQAAAIEPPKEAFDPVMPPVDVEKIQSVLDVDLAPVLKSGDLAPATEGGVTIGVVARGVRRIFSYGVAKPDAVFEIGSITKTFTGLILAKHVVQRLTGRPAVSLAPAPQ